METQDAKTTIRVWPGVVIVALQWLAAFGIGMVQPASMAQGFGMMIGPPLGLLLLFLWWGVWSRASRSEKILGIVVPLAVLVATAMVAHRSMMPMGLFVYAIPTLCLAFVVAVVLTRSSERSTRRLAWIAAVLVTGVAWASVRTEGVDGDMGAQFSWRWQSTAEERLLESEPELAALAPPPAPPAVPSAPESAPEETGEEEAEEPVTSDGAEPAVEPEAEAPSAEILPAETLPAEPPAAWPGFRGAERSGVIPSLTIATDWQASPPEEIWRRPVGPGWGSFVVAGDLIYTQEQRGDDELVSAYRASTGEPVWMHRDEARFWESLAGAGPRATPELHDGRLYSFGATGVLNALDAATGARIWSRDVAADTSAPLPEWGFSSSPLVVDGLVVVYTGATDGKAVAAYDAESGEPRWYAPSGGKGYSSVHLANLHGVPQLIVLNGDGVSSHAPADGAVLWEHSWPGPGARCVQPGFAADGDVLVGTGFGMGLRRLDLDHSGDGWQVEEQWTTTRLKPYYNDFVVHEGHVYGFDGRILAAIDLESGELRWKGGRYGNGQLVLLAEQDLLLVLSDRGDVALVAADPSGFSELARMPAIEGKTWNHPVVADGVLYVRNGEEMAAFRLPVSSQVASK